MLASVLALGPGLAQELSANDLVAHEWGTFTSIQGGDGELLQWNTVDTEDLPDFVYNWSKPGTNRFPSGPILGFQLSKSGIPALQRMETPVIYFYTDEALSVDVTVQFPQGWITEWYPQASEVGPSQQGDATSAKGATSISNSMIRWDQTEILPHSKGRPSGHDQSLGYSASENQCTRPADDSGNHYFAARETDANLLRVDALAAGGTTQELEKFLFYRGVGRFPTPLRTTMSGSDVSLVNTGDAPLKHLFLLDVREGMAAFAPVGDLKAAARTAASLNFTNRQAADEVADELSRMMADALESEGLFRREAEAMVKTWRDAWFAEPGTRVLYVLPRDWTDETLPIEINPQPRELVRVMVGRAELITPSTEATVRKCVALFQQADTESRAEVVRRFHDIGLGRFAAPAIDLVIRGNSDKEFAGAARELLRAAQASAKPEPPSLTAQTSAGRLQPEER